MPNYSVVIAPDPVLKEKAQPVDKIDTAVTAQIDAMFDTMYAANGIGLAANQVGLLNRIFVMDLEPDSWEYGSEEDGVLTIQSVYRTGEAEEERKLHPIVMVNPEIVWEAEQQSIFPEGCLSLPAQYGDVVRPSAVRVKYLDRDGQSQEDLFEGLASHCVQHEIDHLNGVLFIDYLSSLKRNMILRKVKKIKADQAAL